MTNQWLSITAIYSLKSSSSVSELKRAAGLGVWKDCWLSSVLVSMCWCSSSGSAGTISAFLKPLIMLVAYAAKQSPPTDRHQRGSPPHSASLGERVLTSCHLLFEQLSQCQLKTSLHADIERLQKFRQSTSNDGW